MQTKVCGRCKQEKSAQEFQRFAARPDGLRPNCKACDNERDRARYAANPEPKRERDRRFYAEHHAEIAERKAIARQTEEYRQATRERVRRYARTPKGKAKADRERRKYDQTERGKINARMRTSRRRALLLGARGEFTTEDWLAILEHQGHRCKYCDRPFGDDLKPTIDHVHPLFKGGAHDRTNIVAACKSCNSKKYTHSL